MKRALVIGCAVNVWSEVEEAQKLCRFDRIYCVKLAAVHWPGKFDVFVTLHPEWADDYRRQREALGYPMGFESVAPPDSELGTKGKNQNIDRRVSYCWPGMNASASSGIYGAKVALDDGCDRVVLAGVPMTSAPHFTRGKPWEQVEAFTTGLNGSIPFIRNNVRSMSGRTAALLGKPTTEWLAG